MQQHTLSDFDFDLPPELIAQHPPAIRSSARLLDARCVLRHNKDMQARHHRVFHELPQLLQAGDLLVFNDTKVVKARLYGERATGGKAELLIERVLTGNQVVGHLRISKKPQVGETLSMANGAFLATFLGRWPDANPLVDSPSTKGGLFRFVLADCHGSDPQQLMQLHGHLPLPPYISHADTAEDAERYQTVFAKNDGAIAAPTAALHFDTELLQAMTDAGIASAHLTLHVGAGTFQPVKTHNIADHVMHFERYHIPQSTLQAIQDCKARGGKVVAVGTTSVRALESWAKTKNTQGDTNIFITPGFEFKVVDALVTNFHLPQSSLMMLVSAFAGFAHIRAVYQEAIAQRYRFFSYGDAMLLDAMST